MSSYKCSNCDYISSTKGLIKKHIDNVSKCKGAELIENIVKVECGVCNKKFNTEKLLLIHKKKCIEKKVIVKDNFIDPKDVNDKITQLVQFCKNLADENITLREEMIILRNRINIIEKRGPKTKEVIAEDLEEDEDVLCEYNKPIKFIPTTYENTKYFLRDCHCEDFSNVKMTIRGQRDYIVEGSVEETCIIIGDAEYSYEPKSGKKLKGRKYTDVLKIEIVKYCYCEKLKGENFCVDHLE